MKSRQPSSEERFPQDLLWQVDGHVSDLVVAALADGESELVAGPAVAHVDSCVACTERMANAAVLALSVDAELTELARLTAPTALAELAALAELTTEYTHLAAVAPARGSRFPGAAVALAVVVAALGALPVLLQGPKLLLHASHLGRNVVVLGRGLRATLPVLLERASATLFVASLCATFLLILGGLLVARAVPRELLKGPTS